MPDGFDGRLEQAARPVTEATVQGLMERWNAAVSPLIDQQFNKTKLSAGRHDYDVVELDTTRGAFEEMLVQRVFELQPSKSQLFFTLHGAGDITVSRDFLGSLDYSGTPIGELKSQQIEQAFRQFLTQRT